jgi:hypothetical protein
MGVYTYNNMGNMAKDVDEGVADLIVHMGDHAYNMGDSDESRADGYMTAYQQLLSRCPWMPVSQNGWLLSRRGLSLPANANGFDTHRDSITRRFSHPRQVVGNHEYYAGEELSRYLDMTWQKWKVVANNDSAPAPRKQAPRWRMSDYDGNSSEIGEADAAEDVAAAAAAAAVNGEASSSPSHSAMGNFIAMGNFHAAATAKTEDGTVPSGTSRYFSVNVGKVIVFPCQTRFPGLTAFHWHIPGASGGAEPQWLLRGRPVPS